MITTNAPYHSVALFGLFRGVGRPQEHHGELPPRLPCLFAASLALLPVACLDDPNAGDFAPVSTEAEPRDTDDREDATDSSGAHESHETETDAQDAVPPNEVTAPTGDGNPITGASRIDDTDVDPQWPEVVAVSTTSGMCSGTLISPVHVLTAGHCGTGTSVRLDTPAGSGAGDIARREYDVVQTQILSASALSGQDLALMLLDRAVPSFGTQGAPEYAVDPAFTIATLNPSGVNWTVGYGTDCGGGGYGTRRGLMYAGGFSTYGAFPGVVTRLNLGCGNPTYQGPNTGDSGGPLLDVFGRVVGVFSGWSCRDVAGNIGTTGCTGTIEWTRISAANSAWILESMSDDFDDDGIADAEDPRPNLDCTGSPTPPACAELHPDFEVTQISPGGCTGPGGDPVVAITVRNLGPVTARMWVDIFIDEPVVPTMGDWGATYRRSDPLAMGESDTMYFSINPASSAGWVDVILDTVEFVDELDEGNNIASAYLDHADCSFN